MALDTYFDVDKEQLEKEKVFTRVIHRDDKRFYNKNDLVRIDRQTIFGNPFEMRNKSEEERYRVISDFFFYFYMRLLDEPKFLEQVLALQGKVLWCWCNKRNDPKACHGHIIANFVDITYSYSRDQIYDLIRLRMNFKPFAISGYNLHSLKFFVDCFVKTVERVK